MTPPYYPSIVITVTMQTDSNYMINLVLGLLSEHAHIPASASRIFWEDCQGIRSHLKALELVKKWVTVIDETEPPEYEVRYMKLYD